MKIYKDGKVAEALKEQLSIMEDAGWSRNPQGSEKPVEEKPASKGSEKPVEEKPASKGSEKPVEEKPASRRGRKPSVKKTE